MAPKTLLKLTAILSLLIFLTLHSKMAISTNTEDEDDEEEEYVVDTPISVSGSKSRFLARILKKGMRCDPIANNICNGVPSSKGTGLLYCCKKHCRNVLRDKNNCSRCGHKCKQGQRCCNGICTDVLFHANHCGKCERKCIPGVSCENGFCGYA
ncbi:hypothetical protein L6164_022597 [Bauhinia variegata]|uniref:Uncharacterized protein n=1 Tax=Bauhinia variegata TaxID=167791 RepID=A0ACB9MIL0_BAUVA|nr:hypothetical protein L6164_022597 [Bauhinia variegata]